MWVGRGLCSHRSSMLVRATTSGLNFTRLTSESQLSVNDKAAAPVGGAASASFNLRRLLHLLAGRGLRLQSIEIIGGLLRVAGGGEDRALVVLQNFEP